MSRRGSILYIFGEPPKITPHPSHAAQAEKERCWELIQRTPTTFPPEFGTPFEVHLIHVDHEGIEYRTTLDCGQTYGPSLRVHIFSDMEATFTMHRYQVEGDEVLWKRVQPRSGGVPWQYHSCISELRSSLWWRPRDD